MRSFALFAAQPRASVREFCAIETAWTTAERTRRGQFGGRDMAMLSLRIRIGLFARDGEAEVYARP